MAPRYTPAKKAKILGKFDGRCAYCGVVIQALTVDHIVPECKGGTKVLKNLYPSCYDCNHCKGDLSVEEFRKKITKDVSVIYNNRARRLIDQGREKFVNKLPNKGVKSRKAFLNRFPTPVQFYFERKIEYINFTVAQDPNGAIVFAPESNVGLETKWELSNLNYKSLCKKYPPFRPGWGLG